MASFDPKTIYKINRNGDKNIPLQGYQEKDFRKYVQDEFTKQGFVNRSNGYTLLLGPWENDFHAECFHRRVKWDNRDGMWAIGSEGKYPAFLFCRSKKREDSDFVINDNQRRESNGRRCSVTNMRRDSSGSLGGMIRRDSSNALVGITRQDSSNSMSGGRKNSIGALTTAARRSSSAGINSLITRFESISDDPEPSERAFEYVIWVVKRAWKTTDHPYQYSVLRDDKIDKIDKAENLYELKAVAQNQARGFAEQFQNSHAIKPCSVYYRSVIFVQKAKFDAKIDELCFTDARFLFNQEAVDQL